ncbi:MAG: asparagine synthase-related protein [Holdemania massiliensis]
MVNEILKGEEKGLLRMAFEDKLPAQVAHRKKIHIQTYHPDTCNNARPAQ